MQKIVASVVGAALLALGGCASNQFTYTSTTTVSQTVKLVELSSNEVIWSVDVPVGQQLTLDFNDRNDKTNPARPDLMSWRLSEIGGSTNVKNTLPAPPSWNRRIDTAIRRQGAEAVPAAEAVAQPESR
jgi:hypothetical protein